MKRVVLLFLAIACLFLASCSIIEEHDPRPTITKYQSRDSITGSIFEIEIEETNGAEMVIRRRVILNPAIGDSTTTMVIAHGIAQDSTTTNTEISFTPTSKLYVIPFNPYSQMPLKVEGDANVNCPCTPSGAECTTSATSNGTLGLKIVCIHPPGCPTCKPKWSSVNVNGQIVSSDSIVYPAGFIIVDATRLSIEF